MCDDGCFVIDKNSGLDHSNSLHVQLVDISLYLDAFLVNNILLSFLHIISQNMITLFILVAMDIVNIAQGFVIPISHGK